MTDEEKAEEWIVTQEEAEAEMYANKKHCSKCISFGDCMENAIEDKCEAFRESYADFLAGIEAGKPKWHDLRKDPNDLPKEGIEVLVLYSNTYDDNGLVLNKYALRYELAKYINDEEDLTEWYWIDARTDDMVHEVIAWCEHPKFEE
ncbi:MAG: hypothetical protein MJZ37_00945 [Bacilli bacterium]|nr:hypothetical protein [Bacilli bacterium]